jgi:hypothetical protein
MGSVEEYREEASYDEGVEEMGCWDVVTMQTLDDLGLIFW